MSKSIVVLIFFTCVVAVVGVLLAADDPPVTTIDKSDTHMMRQKLKYSQMVLEGLLTEDFAMIANGARQMKRISVAADWTRTPDAVYEHYSGEFRRQCSKLEDLALKENHEGAAFTYLHMTTVCINCHDNNRYVVSNGGQPQRRDDVRLIPAEWPDDQPRKIPDSDGSP